MGLEVAAVGLLAAGAGAKVAGDISAGNAAYSAGKVNERMALDNAKLVRLQGEDAIRNVRTEAAQVIGGAQAGYGASGVRQSGSVLSVLEASAANAEQDVLNIEKQTKLQERQYKNQARLARMEGANAMMQSRFGAASSILGAGAQGVGMFL